ncbi:hypothetical protein ASE03_02450 [Kitasatospora sp. Root187]|nr:hypothetical protein ASC99_02290 [Kitasatospora sp. Root107]KRB67236.1 hypothetical protein ASE03_02450 [Kitasatospora sp. Root187]
MVAPAFAVLALLGLWSSIGNNHSLVQAVQVSAAAYDHGEAAAAGPVHSILLPNCLAPADRCPEGTHESDHHLAHPVSGGAGVPVPGELLMLGCALVLCGIVRSAAPPTGRADSSRPLHPSGRLVLSLVCVSRT